MFKPEILRQPLDNNIMEEKDLKRYNDINKDR